MADVLAELEAIKVPTRETESYAAQHGQGHIHDESHPDWTPCCVFHAPWFEIGEPDWNLEDGCTNKVMGFNALAAEGGSLYVKDGVHLKDDCPVGSVCRRCELASRAMFTAQHEREQKREQSKVLRKAHRRSHSGRSSDGGGGGDGDDDDDGVSDVSSVERGSIDDGVEAELAMSKRKRQQALLGTPAMANVVLAAMDKTTLVETAIQTGRSLDPGTRPLGAMPSPEPVELETPRELIASRFQEQITALERRLKQRRLQLDFVRKVYYKDVFTVKEHMFQTGNKAPFEPTFQNDMPSSVELQEFIKLFDPTSTLEVLPKDDIDSLRRDRVKMLALNRDFKQLQESSARLARRHQQLSKSARNVASRADRAELEVARLVGVVDDLGLQLRDKDEELAATRKQVADKASETMKLESKAAEMQTMIESAQAQTQTLQAALDDAEKAIRRGKRVKQQLEYSEQENKKLRKQLTANQGIVKEKKRLEGVVQQLNKQIQSLQEEVQESHTRVQELRAQQRVAAEEAAADVARVEREKAAVEGVLEQYKQRLQQRTKQLEDTEERLARVTGQRDELQTNLEAKQAEADKLSDTVDATREKLYEAQTMCADRQATIDERDATIGELEATITALRADIEEKDASIARLEPYVQQTHELTEEVRSLREKLDTARAWADDAMQRHRHIHYLLTQAADGRGPPDLQSNPGSALRIVAGRLGQFRRSKGTVLPADEYPVEDLDDASVKYITKMDRVMARQQARNHAADDLCWLETDSSMDAAVDKLAQVFAKEVVTNREWTIRIQEMKDALALRYEGTIKELKERVAKLSDTGRRLQADNDKLKNTLIKRDATIHMRELDITKLNERIAEWQAKHKRFEGAATMQQEELRGVSLLWREARRRAFRVEVEVDVIRSGYTRLKADYDELLGSSTTDIETLRTNLAETTAQMEHFRMKFAEAVKKAEDAIPVTANKAVQVRFGGVHATVQTEEWEGMRRREGPPPRVDLTLPRGAYYYMPYHADAFVRAPSATIRPPPDARPETDDDDAPVRTLQPSTSARGLHSGAGAPSTTRRSVSPINARPRSAMSRGSGGASGHWSPPHSGRAGSPTVLHSGRGASSGVHLPHEAVPRLAVHRGSRGYVRVSDADLGVVVDDTPGVTELEAWGSAGRFDDGMGAAYSHRSARSTGRAQRSQSTTTAQPHGLGTPRRLNPLDDDTRPPPRARQPPRGTGIAAARAASLARSASVPTGIHAQQPAPTAHTRTAREPLRNTATAWATQGASGGRGPQTRRGPSKQGTSSSSGRGARPATAGASTSLHKRQRHLHPMLRARAKRS